MTTLPPPARLPLLALGLVSLLTGVLAGLARLGLSMPDFATMQAGNHAALMISAFFGTVICIERAVALGGWWPYLGPALAGSGGVMLAQGGPLALAQWLFVLAAGVLLAAGIVVSKRQFALFTVMLAVGAASWLAGGLVWAAGGTVQQAIPFWFAFLVLTIAGERLELTRFLPAKAGAAPSFVAISVVILLSAAAAAAGSEPALQWFATALLALTAWLLRFDIARHTARQQGLTRFIGICLLTGYLWLGVAGIAGLAGGFSPASPFYDVAIHAIALGFVFAMVFGHAAIIFPAVLKVNIPYHPLFYVSLFLLHLSLALRFGGSLDAQFGLRQAGAIANALTLLAFILTMLGSVLRGRRRPAGSRRRRAR